MTQIAILVASLLGFIGLAAASERHFELILPKALTSGQRRVARTTGWILLMVALVLCVADWGSGTGPTLWFGGLTIVGVALAFYLPKWPLQPVQEARPARKAKAAALPTMDERAVFQSTLKRRIVVASLVIIPILFVYVLYEAPVKSTMRADAYHGKVGPWEFSFAEADRKKPKLVAMDVPTKEYYVRFCAACDTDIRTVYLKVNKPRSLRGAGMMFFGARWDRWVDVNLPLNAKSTDLFWITVEGKDGSVHHASIPLAEVSPVTAKWLDEQNKKKSHTDAADSE
jgi:hypothetical protein